MLRGKLKSAALHVAISIESSIIESVRMLLVLAPSSERESDPDRRMFRRPSSPGAQPAKSVCGHARGVGEGTTGPDGDGPGEPLVPGVAVLSGVGVAVAGVIDGDWIGRGVKLGVRPPGWPPNMPIA